MGIKNCLHRFNIIVQNVRKTMLFAVTCSDRNEHCIFKKWKSCPGVEGVIGKLTEYLKEEIQEEITFAIWEGNDLVKKNTN